MKKTTTLSHTLEIDYYKALEYFVDCNNDILKDLAHSCTPELYLHLQSYTQAIKDFQDYNIKNICKEGYTMMLLRGDEFNFVEDFFGCDPENEDIQLKIVRDEAVVEIISSDYLQY